MPAPSGYTSRLPTDVILDTGVLRTEIATVATIVGVSRGGLRFDPGITMREMDYDGRRSPIVGGDRITFRRPMFTGTMLLVGPEDLRIFEPAAGGTGSAPGTVVPKPAGTPFVIGEYLKNVSLTFSRSGSATATIVITFPTVSCTKYEINTTDENEGEVPITIEARLDRADAGNTDLTVPYTIALLD